MEYAVIGEHLTHSFSKEIHKELATYSYIVHEVAKEELSDFITSRQYKGLNVTIPYKKDVMKWLDWVDDTAQSIGAVNTIVNRDGYLMGYNTDFFGLSALIRRTDVNVIGEKVLILGTGGTSVTANAVAHAMGAAEVYRVSRSAGDGVITYEEMYEHHCDAGVIINTTPVGMFPNTNAAPIDIDRFSRCHGVIDAIYNPLRSELVLNALSRGIKASGGLYMLVAQAAKAAALFLDDDSMLSKIEDVYQTIRLSKENIVLIGMPGCGKTTVGRRIQQQMERDFFDSDDQIVISDGRDIPTIFKEDGETGFRDLEAATIRHLADKTGCVIATGGGAVLRAENVYALRKNGTLVFLDRPLSKLMPTDDRPLSSNREMLEQRYHERLPVYRASADVVIHANSLQETVETIMGKWNR